MASPDEAEAVKASDLSKESSNRIVFVDGAVDWGASDIDSQKGVYVGMLDGIPQAIGLVVSYRFHGIEPYTSASGTTYVYHVRTQV